SASGRRSTANRQSRRPGHRRDAGAGSRRRRGAGPRPPPRRRLPGHGEAAPVIQPEGPRDPDGPAPVIRVAVADDQALFRAGFRVLLETEDDLELAGEAGDGRAAVELVRRERPDVVLMDVRMP